MSKDTPKKQEYVHPQYAEMAAKHGSENIVEVTLKDKRGNEITVLQKNPDLKATSDFVVWNDKDWAKSIQLLNNRCLLTNKEEVYANEQWYIASATAIASRIEMGSYDIKNG